MKNSGSWAGETHIQKSLYAAQMLFGLPTEYKFVLYKHGPYSFELHDELTEMKAARYVSTEPRDPYGPSFIVEKAGRRLTSRFPNVLTKFESQLNFVAERLSNCSVEELERVSTALFLKYEKSSDANEFEIALARRLSKLKPHIKHDAALLAVKNADRLIADARRVS